jgi:hypothetical protein
MRSGGFGFRLPQPLRITHDDDPAAPTLQLPSLTSSIFTSVQGGSASPSIEIMTSLTFLDYLLLLLRGEHVFDQLEC